MDSVQLQQCQIRIAIVGAIFALLGDIVLEHRRRLGVVSVEAVEDGIDVLRSIGRGVESYSHDWKEEEEERRRGEEEKRERKACAPGWRCGVDGLVAGYEGGKLGMCAQKIVYPFHVAIWSCSSNPFPVAVWLYWSKSIFPVAVRSCSINHQRTRTLCESNRLNYILSSLRLQTLG